MPFQSRSSVTRVVATVQVRMGSSRLPGKALREVAGKPLLGHLLDRLALCTQLDAVVVATSVRPENAAIDDYCASRGIACFRGDEDDVLGRMIGALRAHDATIGVEVFGDCPLIDPAIVDQFIALFVQSDGQLDFVGNDLTTTWPPGMEVEVFSVASLADADRRCRDPAVREHGTLFIRQNPGLYRLRNVEAPPEFRRPEIELEVDTAEDLAVMEAVLQHFAHRPDVGLGELLSFMDGNPDVAAINRSVARRWKEFRGDA
jgi:spore coat polysaccharide biosynthesis protein SpsF (cytidylyltransferase family)